MRKLTKRHLAMLRSLSGGEWTLWQTLGYPYNIMDNLRTDGYIVGETWVTGYVVQITPAGRKALEGAP